jgi:hypothetical protein
VKGKAKTISFQFGLDLVIGVEQDNVALPQIFNSLRRTGKKENGSYNNG